MKLKQWMRLPVLLLLFFLSLGLEHSVAVERSTDTVALQDQRLQKTHDARLAFERERKTPVFIHGAYEDFRAVFVPVSGELTEDLKAHIVDAARKARIQIVLLATRGKATPKFEMSHSGILIIVGGQNNDLMTFASSNPANGSPLEFLRHPELHDYQTNSSLAGIEICTGGLAGKQFLPAFPEESFASPLSHLPQIFTKWDQRTKEKPLIGIGVNDIGSTSMGSSGIDPVEMSFREIVTHILAQELTEQSVWDALANGRAFVAQDWLCGTAGFMFGANNNLGVFGMGDSVPLMGTTRLSANVPLRAKLRVFHKGEVVQEQIGTNISFQIKEPGAYRFEAWLDVAGEERPWIFSNPIYLRQPVPSEIRLPSGTLSEKVTASKNIVYRDGAEEDSGKHKLDIYSPKGQSNAPVLFFIHGGSWKSGDRSSYGALGNRYAKAGFVTVVPSYRLAPKHPHPAQIEDVAAAFAWTANHVSEYGGDTNRLYVSGHSAGGHLAALLALDESRLAPFQLSAKAIRGVLALSGVYNFTIGESQESVFGKDPAIRRDASPLFHIKSDAPPFLLTFCQWDYFSLPAQARQFHAALLKAGVKSDLVFIPRESHISEIVNVWRENDPTVSAALNFMK
jgi:acetyl esterase/lipase